MKSIMKTNKHGRSYVEVTYSGRIMEAHLAMEAAIKKHGIKKRKVTILAHPKKCVSDDCFGENIGYSEIR